jgi:lysosomal acid lipase/cholesteryl ester hydrolase
MKNKKIIKNEYCQAIARAVLIAIAATGVVSVIGCEAPGAAAYKVNYHYFKTDDGVTLAIRRYQPAKINAERDPVILCHGLSYNLMFWDLDPKVSLPRYLAKAGYDVWSLSLRGACPSSQPLSSSLRKIGRFNLNPQMLVTLQKGFKDLNMTDWSVDDHIRYDVPAAIHYVQQQTGRDRVHWIGHSMGGMVMFGYLGIGGADAARQVRSFVAAAVPMAEFHPLNDPFQFLLDTAPVIQVGSTLMGSSSPATLGAIFGDMGTPTDKLFYNGANIDQSILRLMFHLAEEEISPGQLKQLLNMVRTERFQSIDQTQDYTAMLSQITTPVFFLAGTVDNMATPAAVCYAYREVAGDDKKFRLFGRVNSHKNDYGHDDIIIGLNAQQEIYPGIQQWLDAHSYKLEHTQLMLQPKSAENDAGKKIGPQPDRQQGEKNGG